MLILIIIINYKNTEVNIIKEFIRINRKNNKSKIYYYPFIGCGYANKIPTLTSSILLSLVTYHSLFIVNWKQLLFYYKLPSNIFLSNNNICINKIFNRKRVSVLKELKYGFSIKIYTYHSFISSIFLYYNITKIIKNDLYRNRKKYSNVDMYIQDKFLIPTAYIYNHIKKFKAAKSSNFVIGIHIRTGYLSDFGEKDRRFFNNQSIIKYVKAINRTIKSNILSKIYVISDSTLITKYILSLFKNYTLNFTVPGNICHSRYSMHQNNKLNKCAIKLISENYILSECDYLIGSGRSTYYGMACKRKKIKSISVD